MKFRILERPIRDFLIFGLGARNIHSAPGGAAVTAAAVTAAVVTAAAVTAVTALETVAPHRFAGRARG